MAIGLGLGLARFPFDNAQDYWRWVEQCESGGVDSIWQSDRLISKQPMLECLSTMAALAGATETIRFGMNVASIALRDPLLVAKQCATIDFLSSGRLLPAFGLGSALGQDYSATGTATSRRGKKANEALALVRQLWDQDDVNFNGEFFQYERASISPKPNNQHIPLWVGAKNELATRLKKDPADFMVAGSVNDVHQRIEDYIAAGCSKFVMLPIANSTAEMREQTRLFISEVLPRYADRS